MSVAVEGELASFCAEVGATGPVAVRGGGTRFSIGGPLAAETRVLGAPAGIREYRPEEMTVTVLAGTPVAELHAALAEAGQRSALPERGGSVGGALALGEDALGVLTRGKVRNAVLQLRYVSADGVLVKAGAPTVKNVSGFDVARLMVGALGTLGLLAEAVLRTRPIPAVATWLRAEGVDPQVVREAARSAAVVLFDGATTTVSLEGHGVDVDDDSRALGRLGTFTPCAGPPPLPAHRWSLRPAELRHLDVEATGAYVASIGVGTVFAERPQPRRELPAAVRALAERLKVEFDPTGRLSPGRDLLAAH
ncbi:MAG: FAD-binding protein [Actinomycetota bacterium]|nr:FAD-binding protein [Actinomycetota bacterium]